MFNWVYHLCFALGLVVSLLGFGHMAWAQSNQSTREASTPKRPIIHEDLGFTANPQGTVVQEGQSVKLSFMAKGAVRSIQWRLNGQNIPDATTPVFETGSMPFKYNPDQYDVVIKDAFGNQVISKPAAVKVVKAPQDNTQQAAQNTDVVAEHRRQESIKLQAILNLYDVFDQVTARIEEPWGGTLLREGAGKTNFNPCQEAAIHEVVAPVETENQAHFAFKLEMDGCLLPKMDPIGNDISAVASGLYIFSSKQESSPEQEKRTIEKLARNLSISYPNNAPANPKEPVNYHIMLDGKLVKTSTSVPVTGNTRRITTEYGWASGSKIANPQTGVEVQFVSGTYVIEQFGIQRGREFTSIRETRFFNNLKLRIDKTDVLLRGLVNKIAGDSALDRAGKFELLLNNEVIAEAPSAVSPMSIAKEPLPFFPKFNGFFINDYPSLKGRPAAQPAAKPNRNSKTPPKIQPKNPSNTRNPRSAREA